MIKDPQPILEELAISVLLMEDEKTSRLVKQALAEGALPEDIISSLGSGMEAAGEKFENEEYFIPELLLCSDAMYAGVEEVKPYITKTFVGKGCAVIGVVEGDTHDIGKNLVKLFMETSGFEVIDLGRDVPAETFINAVREKNAQLVCMSTLMTTTMPSMRRVVELLIEEGLRDKVKVMVGGAPISQAFADSIGADAYSFSATSAPFMATTLLATPV